MAIRPRAGGQAPENMGAGTRFEPTAHALHLVSVSCSANAAIPARKRGRRAFRYTNLSPDEVRWLALAMAIADGTPIDWSAPSATASGDSSRRPGGPRRQVDTESLSLHALADSSAVLVGLWYLERLVQGHEAVRSRAESWPAIPVAETLLSEAGRKTARTPEESLRVRWGPLVALEARARLVRRCLPLLAVFMRTRRSAAPRLKTQSQRPRAFPRRHPGAVTGLPT
jgi:hypothetical protein